MSKQLDLELDATGVADQLDDLSVKAVELGVQWIACINHDTMRSEIKITDPKVIALLKQAAAVQHLLDKLSGRKGG